MTLPISVIIPTKDCLKLLVRHLPLSQSWIPHVAEIIVVDSYSKDGSLDFLKEKLSHPNIKFFNHPPGLYQSWNFGIKKGENPYTYISTAGDIITLEGLTHLLDSIQKLDCDVVVSPPKFEKEGIGEINHKTWPIHEIIKVFNIEKPTVIPQNILFDFMVLYLISAILGSSASNLYKSSTLKKYPFPEDYQNCGDSAWGIRYNYKVSFGFTPKVFSSFLIHPKENSESSQNELNKKNLRELFLDLAYHTISQELNAALPSLSRQLRSKLQLLNKKKDIVKYKVLYKQYRNSLSYYEKLKALLYRLNYRKEQKKFKNKVIQNCKSYGIQCNLSNRL